MLTPVIDKNYIIKKIGSYSIYDHYIGPFVIGKAMLSPFRNESNPSFIVRASNDGKLYHKDYADDNYSGDCVGLVMQLFSLSFRDALRKITNDFHGINESLKKVDKIDSIKPSTPKEIKVEIRDFNTLDFIYWEQYGVTHQDLIDENIYSVSRFWMDGKEFRAFYELCFGYRFEDGWKIYFPERTDFKWFSSIPNNVIEGWSNVQDFDYLIITKSRKDRLVLSKLSKNVVNAQNESRSLLTKEHQEMFKSFKKIYVFFDADEPGVKACKKITTEMGWNYVNTPRYLLPQGIKDPAEWVKQQGQEPLLQFLKQKKVL